MKSVYLDPSVPSACHERAQPERRKITRRWWKEKIHRYRVLVSSLTIEEIEALETREKREAILSLICDFPLIEITPSAERLAKRYIHQRIIPLNALNDALHISLVATHNIDILLSWNFAHLVKPQVERKINAFNLISGYPRIRIASPKDLMEEEFSS